MPPVHQSSSKPPENRRKRPNLTPNERLQIIAKSSAGATLTELADEFNRTPTTIRRLLKLSTTRTTTTEAPRSGRPPILSRRQKQVVFRKARAAAPKIEYAELSKVAQVVGPDGTTSKPPSKSTLYRALKKQRLTDSRCKVRFELIPALALFEALITRT